MFPLLFGGMAGAGLMYFLDPEKGPARRAVLREQIIRLSNTLAERGEAVAQEAADRAREVVADVSESVRRYVPENGSDMALADQVRTVVEQQVSRPRDVAVMVNQGVVTLSGNLFTTEIQPLLMLVRMVPGVRDVDNQLQGSRGVPSVPMG